MILKRLFEKLLCKHEWKLISEDKTYYASYGNYQIKEIHRVYACKHCGKIFVDDKKFY